MQHLLCLPVPPSLKSALCFQFRECQHGMCSLGWITALDSRISHHCAIGCACVAYAQQPMVFFIYLRDIHHLHCLF